MEACAHRYGPHGLEATQARIRASARNNAHIYSTDALSFEWCGPQAGNGRHYDFAPVGPRLQTEIDDRAIAYQSRQRRPAQLTGRRAIGTQP
jgi:hypothetical protein